MVIDDDVDTADSLAALLRELGQTVRQAYDGRTALILAAQFKPDLILVDVVIPRMDGFEIAAALRNMTGLDAARIVAITGYGGDSLRSMTAAADFNAHLTKPVTTQDLVALLSAD